MDQRQTEFGEEAIQISPSSPGGCVRRPPDRECSGAAADWRL